MDNGRTRVLGVVGSRRRRGNTATLVERVLAGARDRGATTETIYLADYTLLACTGCEACRDSFECILDDDFHRIARMIDGVDALVIGSPTYWYSVTSDVKRLIDRSYALIRYPDGNRRVWTSVWEGARKCAVPVAVCEQPEIEMMGDTLELLTRWMKDLSFEVLSPIRALGFFEAGSVFADETLLSRAQAAGREIVDHIAGLTPT